MYTNLYFRLFYSFPVNVSLFHHCTVSSSELCCVHTHTLSLSQLLFKVLPEAELVPSLLALLRKKRLHKLSPAWQEVTLTALQILLSPSMISQAPGFIDDVIVTVIPLLFTGRHSNVLARRVGEVIVQSALGLAHPVLCDLRDTFSGQSKRFRC